MSWILLIWGFNFGMTIIEFPTQQGCNDAAALLKESTPLYSKCLEIK